jgi:hypothetical protein
MSKILALLLIPIIPVATSLSVRAAPFEAPQTAATYLGFDRNIYPGDDPIFLLRKTFAFAGFWLSPPPGEKTNTWTGKRELLQSQGFGFLLLYRGVANSELNNLAGAQLRGTSDAANATARAKAEGFAPGAIIFLDVEEGGRLTDTYHAYLRAWFAEIVRGGFGEGVYCSAIPVKEDHTTTITTAEDIRRMNSTLKIKFWVYNDVCPTSIGCSFPRTPPSPSRSGIAYASVWQYAQSPRRKEFTGRCAASYQPDGNCYSPSDLAHKWFLDLNTADSSDPSGGRGPWKP